MNSPVNKIDPLGLASRRWEDELLQKQREGLARQRYREAKAAEEKEAKRVSGIAQRRAEALGGTEDDKRIVTESSRALETSVAVGTTVAKTAMEFHPGVIAGKVVNGRDLDGNELSVGERFIEAASLAPVGKVVDTSYDAVKGIKKLVKAGDKLEGAACFLFDTPVHCESGMVPIGQLKVGDNVLALNPADEDFKPVSCKIVALLTKEVTGYYKLTFSSGDILQVTAEHPFWSPAEKCWVPVKELKVSGEVLLLSKEKVTLVQKIFVNETVSVHNITVDNLHTYFVGGSGILVHNKAAARGFTKALEEGVSQVEKLKNPPNPYGKKGGPAHQAVINKLEREFQENGYTVTKEVFVPIPEGGNKSTRFIDLQGKKVGESTVNIQVGKINKNGTPVSRERKAIDDLNKAGKDVEFIPYNK